MSNPYYQDNQYATLPSGTIVKTRTDVDGAEIQGVDIYANYATNTVTPADDLTMSEFGERRVAAPGNRADAEFLYDKQPTLFDDISSGTGSATHRAASRDVLLAVGGSASTAAAGLRQHYWTPYTPGSGQEIDITGTLDAAGLGGECSVFLRSTVSGSTQLTTVAQAQWSAATSGVDWSKSQIMRMSFQSLKVGRIQFALVRNGLPVKVAEITNDNTRATGYWQYASLPPYWKLYNDGTNTVAEFGYGDELNGIGFRYVYAGTNAAATAIAICATVKSQGGAPLFEMEGYPRSVSNGATAKTVGATMAPVISMRVSASFGGIVNRQLIIPMGVSLMVTNPVHWQLVRNPTLTSASFAAVSASYSCADYDTSASAYSGGIVIAAGYVAGANSGRDDSAHSLAGRVPLSLDASGSAGDVLTLVAQRVGTVDSAVNAALEWKEIR